MSAIKSQLVGAWELVDCYAYKEFDLDNDKVFPMGPKVQGMIIYTADGYMSAQFQAPGQSRFKADGPHDGTEEEYAQAGRNIFAYTGPYFLDESGKKPVLYHHMTISSFPNWVGNTQRRHFSFSKEGDDIFLILIPENPSPVAGEMRKLQMKWRRLPDNLSSSPLALCSDLERPSDYIV